MIAPFIALLALTLQRPSDSTFVSPGWLAQHLHDQNLVLLEVGTRRSYDSTHIPGAQFLDVQDIVTPRGSRPMFELPYPDALDSALARHGISNDSRVVLYWGNDWVTPTTRAYLTLDWAGMGDRTSILAGGLPAWRAEGRPVTSDVPTVTRGSFVTRPRAGIVVGAGFVAAHLGRHGVALVDARDTNFYHGNYPASGRDPRPGHIPGAASLPFGSVADDSNRVKSVEQLRALFAAAHVQPGDTVVAYCHVGQQATLVWLAARLAGYEARLYDGSYTEWGSLTEYPVERP
jgi:thiosulfate/3-mercaptopyruvate sulfurtransferase